MPALADFARRTLSTLASLARRAGPLGLIVLALGVISAVLLVIAEFTPLFSVKVITATCADQLPGRRDECVRTGGEQHSFGLILIAVLTFAMSLGAGPGRSRPAAAALIVGGAAVLLIAFVGDLPTSDDTGAIGVNYEAAKGVTEPGLYLEMLGGVLAILAGVLRLSPLGRPPPEPRRRRPERTAAADT